jgi:hypothetical protein
MVDAVQQIRAAQALLDAQPPGRPLNAATLTMIDAELTAADADLARLSAQLTRPSGVVLVGTALPRLSSRIASAVSLVGAAQSACQAGHTLIDAARTILALHDAGFLDDSGHLTPRGRGSQGADTLLQRLRTRVTAAATQLDTAVARARTADLAVLPPSLGSADHVASLRGLLAGWPALHARLAAPDGWQLLAPVILGHAPLAGILNFSVST